MVSISFRTFQLRVSTSRSIRRAAAERLVQWARRPAGAERGRGGQRLHIHETGQNESVTLLLRNIGPYVCISGFSINAPNLLEMLLWRCIGVMQLIFVDGILIIKLP